MKNVKSMTLATLLLVITACGKVGNDMAFKAEDEASSLRSNNAEPIKNQVGAEDAKACESEEDLRHRGAEEFVCLYPEFNYKGQACCIQRSEGAKLVQVPDENPRSKRAGSLVHHGFGASLGISHNPRITTELELECVTTGLLAQRSADSACAKFGAEVNMTFGIYGASDRLSSWSEAGGPVQLFGVKTLIFE